ncbi:MAG: hypothetical protein A2Y12_03990 [Planctomycetes bacterium GWF2_42_9]|nr:MAG: hypothetical protein A2Y12_03990 [Planctomycetes bacterium GWF2_42_9]
MSEAKLRFAALCRVSTEQQEKEGESLRLQKTEIENAVKHLGGIIVAEYGGQEHATPGYEKKEIDRLVRDAQKMPKLFDAVMVTNADRWSRDNQKSREGLDVFKEYNIQFFTGTTRHDLIKPETRLILGMFAEMGQFYAANQKQKSINARIHRAKRGIPTGGKVPYGRILDKNTKQLVVDIEKQAIVEQIANRYLAGEKMPELAEEFGMNHSNLHKILTKRCGDTWEMKFNVNDLRIHETVPMKMPRLLPEPIIQAILKKVQANKTYEHGKTKYLYLLSRMIFCKHCGYAMFGQRNHNGHQYYRHAHTKRTRKCESFKTFVRADVLEDMVMRHLFECFGNPRAVQKAIETATPNLQKLEEYRKRIEEIDKLLIKNKVSKDRILRFIAKDTISDSDAETQLLELKEKDIKLQTEKQQLQDNIGNSPSPDKIKTVSKTIAVQFRTSQLQMNTRKRLAAEQPFEEMTYEEKQALVKMVFSGKRPDGKRMGVDIEWDSNGWKFDIHGHLIDKEGLFVLSDARKEIFFGEGGGYSISRDRELCTKSTWHSQGKAPL